MKHASAFVLFVLLLAGCVNQEMINDPAVQTGAVVGAVTGAVIGGNAGKKDGTNIAIGAATGAVLGGAITGAVRGSRPKPVNTGGWQ